MLVAIAKLQYTLDNTPIYSIVKVFDDPFLTVEDIRDELLKYALIFNIPVDRLIIVYSD